MTDAHVIRHARCYCGAVKIEATGDPLWVAHCHCSDCRHATASAFATYVGFPTGNVTISGPLKVFASSPGAERGFCQNCGTPILYRSVRWPGEIHLFASSFDDAADFVPTDHVYTIEQLPWVHLADGLPRHPKSTGEAPDS